jgi:hypothetical protein
MDEENKNLKLSKTFEKFPSLDYKPKETPVIKTVDDVKKEFPAIDYDYGTERYYRRMFKGLPEHAYKLLEENHHKNNI